MTNAVPFARGPGRARPRSPPGCWPDRPGAATTATRSRWPSSSRAIPTTWPRRCPAGSALVEDRPRPAEPCALGPAPVEFVAVIPPYQLSTEQARAAIPPQVPLFDAVYTARSGGAAGRRHRAGRPELIVDALDDRLHEPYRAPLVPLLATVRARSARSPGPRGDALGRRPDGVVWAEPGSGAVVAAGLEGLDGRRGEAALVADRRARIEALV